MEDPNSHDYEILNYGPDHMHIRTYYPANVSVEQAIASKLAYDAVLGAEEIGLEEQPPLTITALWLAQTAQGIYTLHRY